MQTGFISSLGIPGTFPAIPGSSPVMLVILGMRNELGNRGLAAGGVDLRLHFLAGIRESESPENISVLKTSRNWLLHLGFLAKARK